MSIFDNQIIHRHYLTSQSSIVFWQVNHSLCSDKSIIQCLFLTSQSSIVYFWQINIPSFNSDKQTIFIVMIWQASHPLSSDKSIIHRLFLKSQSSIFYFWQNNHPSSLSYKSIIHCRWQVNHPVFIPDKSIFHCVLISQSHIVFWEIIHLSSIFFLQINQPLWSDKSIDHRLLTSQPSIVYFWLVNFPTSRLILFSLEVILITFLQLELTTWITLTVLSPFCKPVVNVYIWQGSLIKTVSEIKPLD